MTPDLRPELPVLAAVRQGAPLVVLTGAGISVESGLPTFRGAGGLWEGSRPEELATPEAFHRDPLKVWRWYEWRRGLVRQAKPNAGHLALARMATLAPRMTLITQNVDELHRVAGSPDVLELHGSIVSVRCTAEGTRTRPTEPFVELPPHCAACGALLRPDVVWFGEPLPEETFRRARQAALDCALFLVVGTSALVAPASGLALTAKDNGARVFEVNPDETPISGLVDGVFRGPSATVLPAIADALEAA